KITSGTISDQRLSPNVALLNTNQTFSASNMFSGVAVLTNANNTLAGNGAAVTALNANNITSGQLPDPRLSPNLALINVVDLFTGTNNITDTNIFASTNIFTGTNFFSGTNVFSSQVIATNPGNQFSGNGGGFTNLNASQLSTGQVPDPRLSPNVALLNGVNLF